MQRSFHSFQNKADLVLAHQDFHIIEIVAGSCQRSCGMKTKTNRNSTLPQYSGKEQYFTKRQVIVAMELC